LRTAGASIKLRWSAGIAMWTWRWAARTSTKLRRWAIAMPDWRWWRCTTPAVTLPIEIPAPVITVPIIIHPEGDNRDAKLTVIVRIHVNAAAGILGLEIAAGNPATIAGKADIAPIGRRQASEDLNTATSRHNQNRRILCAWPCSQINIGGRNGLRRLCHGRQRNSHRPCK
jgi:hypothetical protein